MPAFTSQRHRGPGRPKGLDKARQSWNGQVRLAQSIFPSLERSSLFRGRRPPRSRVSAPNEPATAEEAGDPELEAEAKPDPLERIERSFDAVAFHQAALMLDQVEDSRLAALPPRERAQKLSAQAKDYLDRGLLLEAERLYQSALATDSNSASAHAGAAQIRERTGDLQAARKEAVTSLRNVPSLDAYLVLIRLDIAANHLDEARQNADAALRLDPRSQPALEVKRQIEARQALKK